MGKWYKAAKTEIKNDEHESRSDHCAVIVMVKEQINIMDYQFRLTENNTSLVKDKPGSRIAWFVTQNFKKTCGLLTVQKSRAVLAAGLYIIINTVTKCLAAWS